MTNFHRIHDNIAAASRERCSQCMKPPAIESDKIIRRTRDGKLEYQPDDLTVEEPLEIRIGRQTVAITMRTPGHDDELALGFLFSEALIRTVADLTKISRPAKAKNAQNIIRVDLAGGNKVPTESARRFGTITSSCGICGKDSIAAVRQNFPPIAVRHSKRIRVEALLALPNLLREHQSDFDRTGGIHAAAIFDLSGKLKIVREDIGRHNAVDKVIGRALLDKALPLDSHGLLVSGRASFEIVQKAVAAGIAIIASVSAPSNLAVRFCRENNQSLVGFLRPPSFNIYSHAERVIFE
jgi:FdhD protein